MKTCSRCKTEKPNADYRTKAAHVCKTCKNKEYREAYKKKHPGRLDESRKRWRENNRDFENSQARNRQKEMRAEGGKAYERRLEISRDWKRRNKIHCKEYAARARIENLEQHKAQCRAYNEKANDAYIGSCLKSRGFRADQITPELIQAQRAIVKIKRKVKEINHAEH